MPRKDLTALSRTMSHALRHEPWLYELELDGED
jgi:putative RNA 2'-phosphotransferase